MSLFRLLAEAIG